MSGAGNLHVVFGTGPVGLAVMDELVAQGKAVRMINRSSRVTLPEGVELVRGDASDPAFAKEASARAEVVYQCLNPPYTLWPELFPSLQAAVLAGAIANEAKLVSMENVYMYRRRYKVYTAIRQPCHASAPGNQDHASVVSRPPACVVI